MKATLEFTLPEEEEEFTYAVDGSRWRDVVNKITQAIRNKTKHEDLDGKSAADVVEGIRKEVWEILDNEGLALY